MIRTLLLSLALLTVSPSAHAQDDDAEPGETTSADTRAGKKQKKAKSAKAKPAKAKYVPMSKTTFGFRGIGEIWQESALLLVHRSSRFGGTGFFGTDFTHLFGMEVELGYNRMMGKAVVPGSSTQTDEVTSLELVPISLDGTVRVENERSEVFLGLGGAFVNFNDRGPGGAISGVKIGIDARVGVRIRTAFMQESLHPSARGVRRMDFELMLGRRQHQAFGFGEGLDLSAWRVGAGLVARL